MASLDDADALKPVAWRFMHDGGWNYSAIDPSQHLVEGEILPLYARPLSLADVALVGRLILTDHDLWAAEGHTEIEAAVPQLAGRIISAIRRFGLIEV